MIKLIIFDLDGVLCDMRDVHYEALNRAISSFDPRYAISRNEHLLKYDGLNTNAKLMMLSETKEMPYSWHKDIFTLKQFYTLEAINDIPEDSRLRMVLSKLKDDDLQIAVCSNSIRQSLKMMLVRTGLIEFVDFYISNEDVKHPKPSSEIYLRAMVQAGASPNETLIVEDSPHGRQAAKNSGANVMGVLNPKDVTYEKISMHLTKEEAPTTWDDPNMNVLIPMSGLGSRFAAAGYTFPKPLIEVNGKPMVQLVVENLGIKAHYIYIVQKDHYEKYNLGTFLKLISPYGCDVVIVDGLTEGAACSVLLAKELIDNDKPLLIANSDQFLEGWNSSAFMWAMNNEGIDGGVVTFQATHPKWSFAKLDEQGFVVEIAEKNPISTNATVGVYYWKKGCDCVTGISKMIHKNIRTNGEFYLAPSINELLGDSYRSRFKNYPIESMQGLGTPEDLQQYLLKYKS